MNEDYFDTRYAKSGIYSTGQDERSEIGMIWACEERECRWPAKRGGVRGWQW